MTKRKGWKCRKQKWWNADTLRSLNFGLLLATGYLGPSPVRLLLSAPQSALSELLHLMHVSIHQAQWAGRSAFFWKTHQLESGCCSDDCLTPSAKRNNRKEWRKNYFGTPCVAAVRALIIFSSETAETKFKVSEIAEKSGFTLSVRLWQWSLPSFYYVTTMYSTGVFCWSKTCMVDWREFQLWSALLKL